MARRLLRNENKIILIGFFFFFKPFELVKTFVTDGLYKNQVARTWPIHLAGGP